MTGQPARIVIAGIEVDAHYADGRDPHVPAGTLTMVTVPMTAPITGSRARGAIPLGLVGMGRVDPETKQIIAWELALPESGWIPDYMWPTIEDAVRAIRNPAVVENLGRLRRLRQDAYGAEIAARNLHEQADALQQEIAAADTTRPTRKSRRYRSAPSASSVASSAHGSHAA